MQIQQKTYLRNRVIFVSATLGLIANIILWLVAWGKFGYSQERLPLHFNITYGIDFVGSSRNIYQIPGAGLVVFVLNLILGKMVFESSKLYACLLVSSAVFVQVLLMLALIALVALNV